MFTMKEIRDDQSLLSIQDIPSLLWLRDEIAQRYDIPRQRRMDMVSACNMAARWFHPCLLAVISCRAAMKCVTLGDS